MQQDDTEIRSSVATRTCYVNVDSILEEDYIFTCAGWADYIFSKDWRNYEKESKKSNRR